MLRTGVLFGCTKLFCKSILVRCSLYVMADLSKQCGAVKFCILLVKDSAEVVKSMKARLNNFKQK